jgi:dihydroorotate dehydrogenase electron transfer subunit
MNAYASPGGWRGVSIFACGPDAMMAAVAEVARTHNVRCCQVSLENYMGCGVGVCLSCAAKVRAASGSSGPVAGAPGQGWTYKLACRDGPVFEAADVVFEGQWEGCKR